MKSLFCCFDSSPSKPVNNPQGSSLVNSSAERTDEEEIASDNNKIRLRRDSNPLQYARRAFATPELDMVAGRTPPSAWQAVAAKVVSANRIRRGLGKEVRIEEFRIEELGGRAGKKIFGPVSVFNGNVTFRVKRPLKGITLSIKFYGGTEVNGNYVNFITAAHDLFSGGGPPQLPVRVRVPSDQPPTHFPDASHLTLPFSHTSEIMEYRTKPFKIAFMPNVDPSLEMPLVSRKPSMRKKRSASLHKKSEARLSAQTIYPPGSPNSPTFGPGSTTPKMRGPKLTLTTVDLDDVASSNSTPVIDRPHPSSLSSAIERTTRITDDDNNTIAKLTIEMPSSRFLPGESIGMKLTLQVNEGIQLPKGMGVRVVEGRSLCAESADGEAAEKSENDEEQDPDLVKMKNVGGEQLRVLTSKKFMLHLETSTVIKENKAQDSGMAGGKELVEMLSVTLPPFETFITNALLPTAILPLGDPRSADDTLSDDPSPSSWRPKLVINGKGKSVESSSAQSPAVMEARGLYFRVQHLVHITVPMVEQHHSHWYSKANRQANAPSASDLEVTVPIIMGNKNPVAKPPELRLNMKTFEPSEGSSSASSAATRSWKQGMKFGNLRESMVRPAFVVDS
ncbi:hypothetical protein FN846DRAFT_773973 [Sphaerosporella brunnea]|uniref:Uncharacterized protein n=1 Tax=Sphaerosporella brunnea TaxID=1250544 RepID=A0A5J5F5Y6_9PEZI|nr:hypothetical protein FN846DRAFT_773973 [Sphaerosporella brunnea]